MRDKDQIILENAYSKIKTIKEQVDDTFTSEVNVDIFQENHDISLNDSGLKITVKYKIELEYRSWGLKDIYLHLVAVEPFTVDWEESYNQDEPTPEPLRFQLTPAEVEVEQGNLTPPIYPQTLEIYLDKNNKIVQGKTKLVF